MNELLALFGGIMIGLSAVGLLLTHGKIAGISGITKGLFASLTREDRFWRMSFLSGVILGGGLMILFLPEHTAKNMKLPLGQMLLAGLLVGVGTSIGNGCTSGHGICGLGRKSKRSFTAVLIFMFTALVTMYISTHLLHLPRL